MLSFNSEEKCLPHCKCGVALLANLASGKTRELVCTFTQLESKFPMWVFLLAAARITVHVLNTSQVSVSYFLFHNARKFSTLHKGKSYYLTLFSPAATVHEEMCCLGPHALATFARGGSTRLAFS